MAACILCGATGRDRFGGPVHEPCCPHFMRGPDQGGDPHEWPTIMDAIKEVENMPRTILVHLNIELDDDDERTADEVADYTVVAATIGFEGGPELAPGAVVCPLAEEI